MNGRVLIVDDDKDMCDLVAMDLSQRGYETTTSLNAESGFELLIAGDFDVVLTDLKMPGINGVEFCHRIVSNRPDIPVIVITAFGLFESAVEAIRAGAFDFITKPIELDLLEIAIRRAVQQRKLQQRVARLEGATTTVSSCGGMIGISPTMQRLFRQIASVAAADLSVLIAGESGTGKELVARAIHDQSPRRDKPFVALNCAALPAALLESELFGHAAGAFTNAQRARKGMMQEADGGTLFLDEIGELSLDLQPKILRVLEQRTVRPVGANLEANVDIRVIAASNRDLEADVESKRFREDLFYRLNVVQLDLPPLRARGTDVLLIAESFIAQFVQKTALPIQGMMAPFAERLLEYSWPGNVRELRNVIERAVTLTQHAKLSVEDLPEKIRAYRKSQLVFDGKDPAELLPIDEVEKKYIFHVCECVDWNRTMAAKILGLDRKTLYRKLLRYGIEKS